VFNKGYKSINFWGLIPVIVALILVSRIFPNSHKHLMKEKYGIHFGGLVSNEVQYYFLPQVDTIYYLGDDYIEINLKSQIAMHITKSGEVDTVKISSGNKFLPKAIETPTGLYTVQNKAPIQISRQFENTEMLNWIGFNGNIGFHGLKKKGYYWSLGKRPSSHGCVRMSNEDGLRWYAKIKIGTPVLVYHTSPIRIIKFADYKEFDPNEDLLVQKGSKYIYSLLNQRLLWLLQGEHYRKNKGKIFLPFGVRLFNSNVVVETEEPLPKYQKQKVTSDVGIHFSRLSTLVSQDYLNLVDTCSLKR